MLTKNINYTNLRQNLASMLDEAIKDRNIIIVSRPGKEDVAILAASELSSMLETLHLLKPLLMLKSCLLLWNEQKN